MRNLLRARTGLALDALASEAIADTISAAAQCPFRDAGGSGVHGGASGDRPVRGVGGGVRGPSLANGPGAPSWPLGLGQPLTLWWDLI